LGQRESGDQDYPGNQLDSNRLRQRGPQEHAQPVTGNTFNDVEATLSEIAFAFGQLNADGVVMVTNYGGNYLGNARFEPEFAELNKKVCDDFHPTNQHVMIASPAAVQDQLSNLLLTPAAL
jgi:hypothetical protein